MYFHAEDPVDGPFLKPMPLTHMAGKIKAMDSVPNSVESRVNLAKKF